MFVFFVYKGEQCFTPNRQRGICQPFQQCYSLLRLFSLDRSRSTVNFLVLSQQSCGNRNLKGDPLLCCTDVPRRVEPTTAEPFTRPPFEPQVDLSTRSPLPAPSTAPPPLPQEGRQEAYCYGPDDIPGACVCKYGYALQCAVLYFAFFILVCLLQI